MAKTEMGKRKRDAAIGAAVAGTAVATSLLGVPAVFNEHFADQPPAPITTRQPQGAAKQPVKPEEPGMLASALSAIPDSGRGLEELRPSGSGSTAGAFIDSVPQEMGLPAKLAFTGGAAVLGGLTGVGMGVAYRRRRDQAEQKKAGRHDDHDLPHGHGPTLA